MNRQFFFHLYGYYPVIESSGMTVNNFDAAIAAAQGAPVGWSVGRQRVFPVGNEEPAVVDYVAIDPADITGRIVLRMTFDDATDLLTCAFSLDGGATFQSPFAPLQAFKRSPHAELLIGAAAIPSAPPPPACTVPIAPVKVKFQKVSSPLGEQNFRMNGRLRVPAGTPPVLDPVTQGVVFGADSGLGPVTGYEAPPGARGGGGCGPDDGWRHAGRTWTYINKTGAQPPFCEPGGVNGLRKVRVRDDRAGRGEIRFSIVARETIIGFAPGGPAVAVAWIGGLDAGGNPVTCANQPLSCLAKGSSVGCK